MNWHSIAALGIVAFFSTFAQAHDAIDRQAFARAEQAINAAIEREEIPGAVLVAGRAGEIVYRHAFGNRSVLPAKSLMTLDTVFDLASLSKSIGCATSVMILHDRAKFDIHDPIAKYLPELAQNGKESVTIEQTLLHRGGFVADNPMADFADGFDGAWKKICESKPSYEPGTKFVYSDTGFIVLGELVHRVDGRPLDRFAREETFEPLGMKHTAYNPGDELKKSCAPTEQRAGKWMIGEVHDPRAFAMGGVAGHAGVFSTADDVARWCQMLLLGGELDHHRILKTSTVHEMLTMRTLPDGSAGRGYGVDFESNLSGAPRGNRFERGTTFGHTGYTGTCYWVDPKNDCFYVLLTNRVHPSDAKGKVTEVRRAVATAVAEAFLGATPTTTATTRP